MAHQALTGSSSNVYVIQGRSKSRLTWMPFSVDIFVPIMFNLSEFQQDFVQGIGF